MSSTRTGYRFELLVFLQCLYHTANDVTTLCAWDVNSPQAEKAQLLRTAQLTSGVSKLGIKMLAMQVRCLPWGRLFLSFK
jgi:hypothetical protein